MDANEPTLDKIVAQYPEAIKGVADGDSIMDFEEAYEALFGYFFDKGEMPYGIAKARTGMPDEWIADELDRLGYLKSAEKEEVETKSIAPDEEFEDWADVVD